MMKQRQVFVLVVSTMALSILACQVAGIAPGGGSTIRGSGNVVTQEEAITGFDRLDVSQGFQVDVRQGDTFSVVIRADDNLVEHVQVAKEGSTLVIGLKRSLSYSLQNVTLEADVTMPELTRADLSGGSHLRGDVEAGDVTFNLSGGSHVTLSGSAGNLTVDADGGSHAKLADLTVVDADVDASGGSHVTINPSGRLDAVAKGGSHVRYLGNPTLGTTDADVSSSVKQD
jgi:hypothetical protein